MEAHLVCFSEDGGIPIFSRAKGNTSQLSFPDVAALNSTRLFGFTKNVNLFSTKTKGFTIVWNSFNDGLVYILVMSEALDVSERHALSTLSLIQTAIKFLVGPLCLENSQGVDRLKKDIKVSVDIVDLILGLLIGNTRNSHLTGYFTHSVDTLLASESGVLQNTLKTFVSTGASSSFGCLCVSGLVALATEKWWSLPPVELSLLSLLLNSLQSRSTLSRDIPVFLPMSSPKVPLRFVTLNLVPHVDVCLLCGPDPPLHVLQREAERFWLSAYGSLGSISRAFPRNIPDGWDLDANIYGFIIIHSQLRKALTCLHPSSIGKQGKGPLSTRLERHVALRDFYKHVVHSIVKKDGDKRDADGKNSDLTSVAFDTDYGNLLSHECRKIYLALETHKCFFIKRSFYFLFAIYHTQVPTHSLSILAENLLDKLTTEKNIHF